ncbi:Cgl0159 family (beta/alpha)8-fold protein [Rhodohalobacter sulfatireducens]|uniref:Cgl0159-like domain-containing protein n=1 Tax=Rhodohalobacter sulfatireducens TaxID=2911366 RepID=A0ABS9KJS2_9BACT|nr:hypothetical protein [Rhodohalobacter sulfatireducens]MCG2591074.1 hypothetical protein [Rhodohalobacter sulfatireducens]
MSSFSKEKILPSNLFARITETRLRNPGYALAVASGRVRREGFVQTDPLNIVAADHPARGSLKAGDDALAMADRQDLLGRLMQILQSDWVDGVLGSMDIVEDLLILHGLKSEAGEGFLDNKLLIASLNRGGLPGSAWELDDPMTGPNASTCVQYGLDAAKMLLRVHMDDERSLNTIRYCADGIRDMNTIDRPIFIEPLPVVPTGNGYRVDADPEKLIQLMSVCSALGDSSRNVWLKIPYTEQFDRVVGSTSLPMVILGGGKSHSKEEFLENIRRAMDTGRQVRGTMIGRNMLYPKDSGPLEMAESIGKVVRQKDVSA